MRADLLPPWLVLTAFFPFEPDSGWAVPSLPEMVCVQEQGNASLWVQKRRRHPLNLKLSDTLTVAVRVDSDKFVEVNETQKLRQEGAAWIQVLFETKEGTRLKHWQKVYKVTPLRPGAHALQLPALEYSEGDDGLAVKVAWEPLTLRITTRVAKVDISEARDITPIEEPPPPASATRVFPDWRWLVPAAALVALAVVWLLRRRSSAAKEPSPHEVVLRHLQELQGQPQGDPEQVARWHTRLSDLLRWYLEKRLNLPATRQTASEFVDALERSGQVAAEQQAQLNEILAQCDLVKFARVVPRREDYGHLLPLAQGLIQTMQMAANPTVRKP